MLMLLCLFFDDTGDCRANRPANLSAEFDKNVRLPPARESVLAHAPAAHGVAGGSLRPAVHPVKLGEVHAEQLANLFGAHWFVPCVV